MTVIDRLGQIPNFVELVRERIAILTQQAREANARPVLVAFGRDLHYFGIESYYLGGMMVTPLVEIARDFAVHLGRHHIGERPAVIGVERCLHLIKARPRLLHESLGIEPRR